MVERRLKLTSNKQPKTEAERNRTNPIKNTIHPIKQLHKSAIIYQCLASQFWHFRVFLEGAQRKRSTKETDIEKAKKQAKVIFAKLLLTINDTDGDKNKLSSTKTLDVVAKSLYAKQEALIEQGELEKNKNKKERYVYEKHIRPYFANIELKKINSDVLENFKIHLAQLGLAQSTQKGYLDLVGKLLKEAAKKEYIHRIPIMPSVKTHDDPRGYFDGTEYTRLWKAALKYKDKTYEFKYKEDAAKSDKTYRKTRITSDCFNAIMFMRNTFIRPTDLKFIKHKDVVVYERDGITLLELRHVRTKGHSNYMASTENAVKHYNRIVSERKEEGYGKDEDYLFLPQHENRDYALKEISRQFTAILEITNLRKDSEGRSRTLYSLRHTAIMTAVRQGIPIEHIASNARTSTDMINRFYANQINSALDMGTHVIDTVKRRNERRRLKQAEVTLAEANKAVEENGTVAAADGLTPSSDPVVMLV